MRTTFLCVTCRASSSSCLKRFSTSELRAAACRVGANHLHRDRDAQLGVPGLVDRAHPADAEELDDVIARPETLARPKGPCRVSHRTVARRQGPGPRALRGRGSYERRPSRRQSWRRRPGPAENRTKGNDQSSRDTIGRTERTPLVMEEVSHYSRERPSRHGATDANYGWRPATKAANRRTSSSNCAASLKIPLWLAPSWSLASTGFPARFNAASNRRAASTRVNSDPPSAGLSATPCNTRTGTFKADAAFEIASSGTRPN